MSLQDAPTLNPADNNANAGDYLVLARKYRSRTFGELIGQEALVRTLTNAIQSNRLHHAYVLTGIRGTGKTSTARLLAMALNCSGGPSIDWPLDDPQVQAIAQGRHVDVLEFDAASHTGVDDIRSLFEGVAYAPTQGRYKVYIVDEVHMLSTSAFNALLKTLEEPPANVKFIFATTEIHKVPVTVLSRCQRFDLRRVPAETLATHFTAILQQENITADPAAVAAIARAADGSVRDGLSLLDQAIALAGSNRVSVEVVNGMLGLADRGQLYDLLEQVFAGNIQEVLTRFGSMYTLGQDPLMIVNDLMGAVHLLTRLKVLPQLKDEAGALTELEKNRAGPMAEQLPMESLSRVYQMLGKVHEEVKSSEKTAQTAEMGLIRTTYLGNLPAIETLLNQHGGALQNAAAKGKPTPQAEAAPAAKKPASAAPAAAAPAVQQVSASSTMPPPWEDAPVAAAPENWEQLVQLVQAHKPALAALMAQHVRPVSMEGTTLTMVPESRLYEAQDVAQDVQRFLHDHTGQRWAVNVTEKGGGATVAETRAAEKEALKQQAREDADVKQILEAFPDAEIVDVVPPTG